MITAAGYVLKVPRARREVLLDPEYCAPVHYENLRRLGLMIRQHERRVPTSAMLDARALPVSMGLIPEELCLLSKFGMAFVSACRAPRRDISK